MHNAAFFLKYKLHHLIIWALVFGAWFFLRYEDYALASTAFKVTLIKVVDLAALIYFANYVLVPQLLYRKYYFLFALCFILLISLSSYFKMYIIGQVTNNPGLVNFSGNWKARIYDNIIPHFFLVMAGVAFKLMFDFVNMEKKMAEMAREKAEAELSFLKSQINPHFLFNSINAVYFLIDKNNSEARNALHRFSEMLRYQLYEVKDKQIPVEKEIRFLKDYINLQKLRKDEHYKVDFYVSPAAAGFVIEPLLLLPLVENAFKHISHKDDGLNYIKVNLEKKDGVMEFEVENSKEQQSVTEKQGGIGLQNVKRRLELLYPGKHELQIQNRPDVYKVNLKLNV